MKRNISHFVYNSSNVWLKSPVIYEETHEQMFKLFVFGFETRIKTISPHVPAFRFQSVSPGAGALVWFSCSQGWKWMHYCDVLLLSCCKGNRTFQTISLTGRFAD